MVKYTNTVLFYLKDNLTCPLRLSKLLAQTTGILNAIVLNAQYYSWFVNVRGISEKSVAVAEEKPDKP